MRKRVVSLIVRSGSQVVTLEQLGIYLQQQAKKIATQLIRHHDNHTYALWKRFITRLPSPLPTSKKQRVNSLYYPILLELWSYALASILPHINGMHRKSVHKAVLSHLYDSLDHEHQHNLDQYDYLNKRIQDNMDKPLADIIYNSIAHLIDGPVIRGRLRQLCIELARSWQQTVITEALTEHITTRINASQNNKKTAI